MRLLNTPRKFLLITVFILIGTAFYLFPEKATQDYHEMPQVFACPAGCLVSVCTHWIPAGPGCGNPGPGGGCCIAYETECKPNCGPPPPPPPPTVSGTLNCSVWGANSWCIGSESLDLNALDSRGAAVLISGSLNGNPFACQNGITSCAIPLPEGTGTANYLVTSYNGTGSGSKNWQLDTVPPSISGNLDQSLNAQNWCNSAVNLSASASDATSGVASLETSLDNATWANYTVPLNFTDGTYTAYLRATDNADNVENLSQEIKVDSQNPQIARNISGTAGENGWYISDVQNRSK